MKRLTMHGEVGPRLISRRALLFLAVGLSTLHGCGSSPEGPSTHQGSAPKSQVTTSEIVCLNPVVDGGVVYEGDLVSATFVLEHRGKQQREIDIETTCGCTNLINVPKVIGGRERAEVRFDVDTKGRGKDGRFDVPAYVHLKNRQRAISLLVKGKVLPLLRVDRHIVHFGDLGHSDSVERTVRIQQTGSRSPTLVGAKVEPPVASAQLREYLFDPRHGRKAWDVVLRVDGSSLSTDVNGWITLKTDDGEANGRLPRIQFYASRSDGWKFMPSFLAFFISNRSEGPVTKNVLLVNRNGADPTAMQIPVEKTFLKAELQDQAPNGGRVVAITFDPKGLALDSDRSGTVEIKATSPGGLQDGAILRVSYYLPGGDATPPSPDWVPEPNATGSATEGEDR